jgi:hypothetical protein
MPYNVPDLLSYVSLMKSVETIKNGLPRVLPPQFWSLTEDVLGDRARVVEFTGTRRVARVQPYGSPARLVEKVGLSDRAVILLHSFEEVQYSDELFRILRNWEQYTPQQNFAMEEITRQGMLFATRQVNLETAAVTAMLANGKLWFDVDGNLLSSSSGATLTVDYQIPANNLNQLNGIISASWATASTNIVAQINALKVRATQATGFGLTYAFYGQNIPTYFSTNDSIKEFWWRNPQLNQNFMDTGILPRGMLGLIWVPVQEAFYEDSSGNTVQIFGGDTITFTPDINAATYHFLRGSYPVPTSYGPMPDGDAALKSFKDVHGMYRYAKVLDNPSRMIDLAGNTFLPRFKNPNTIFIADVTP